MTDRSLQKEYWKGEHVLSRRPARHPAVRAFVEPKLAFFRECLASVFGRPLTGLSVLDVGAGNGFLTHYLMEVFGHVTAIDFSEAILRGNPSQRRVLADVGSLPFRDCAFDVVLCSNLLHHVPDPQRAVDEMSRVARLALGLSEPNRNNPLMFSFAALVPPERGTLKFDHRFLKSLIASAEPTLELLGFRTQGVVVPNKTPAWAVPLVKAMEPFLVPRMYLLCVARRLG